MEYVQGASGNGGSRVYDAMSGILTGYREVYSHIFDTPVVLRDIEDFDLVANSLRALVERSDIPTRREIGDLLEIVRKDSLKAAARLQEYASRLTTGLRLSMITARRTLLQLERAESSALLSFWPRLWCSFISSERCYADTTHAHDLLYQMLQYFEFFCVQLIRMNHDTARAVGDLDQSMNDLEYIVERDFNIVGQEIGELLQRLWTRLGGNRTKLADAERRADALLQIGIQAKRMKELTTITRRKLEDLRGRNEELRLYASQPLLFDGNGLKVQFLHSLMEECSSLRESISLLSDHGLVSEANMPLISD